MDQEERHNDSTSASTIGNFFYRFFYTFIEPSITGIVYLFRLVFCGILIAVEEFWNTAEAVFAIIFAIVVFTLPITVYKWLGYLALKVEYNVAYLFGKNTWLPVLIKSLAFVVMIGASCYLLAVPFSLNLLAGAASIFAYSPSEMLLTLMINFICYSPLGLGMSFSLVSMPFLLSVVFVGLPALRIFYNYSIRRDPFSRGEYYKDSDKATIPLYATVAGLFMGLIVAEKVAMMYWSISLLGMINVPLVLVGLLTTCLVVGRVFSIESINYDSASEWSNQEGLVGGEAAVPQQPQPQQPQQQPQQPQQQPQQPQQPQQQPQQPQQQP